MNQATLDPFRTATLNVTTENGHRETAERLSHSQAPASSHTHAQPEPVDDSVTTIVFRFWLFLGVIAATAYVYFSTGWITPRAQALIGIFTILGLVALFSRNLAAVSWRPLFFGFGLQMCLAVFVMKFEIFGFESIGIADGTRPGYEMFAWLGDMIGSFLRFGQRGIEFTFGMLVNADKIREVFGPRTTPIFAFAVLPTIIFVSSLLTILYYFGILQFIVRIISRVVMGLLGTSGAETLSAVANVFLGQIEAPLIVKPFIKKMTQSELLALMVAGMATISGSLMAVYIGIGADPVSLLVTSVMAAPASLYLAKLMLPETETPVTHDMIKTTEDKQHRNVIDAAASGAIDGMHLALNIAAMLIAFISLIAMIDTLLRYFPTNTSLPEWFGASVGWPMMKKYLTTMVGFAFAVWILRWPFLRIIKALHLEQLFNDWKKASFFIKAAPVVLAYFLFLGVLDIGMRKLPDNLSLGTIFSTLFYPLALLIGVSEQDAGKIASLLGTKLATNEFVAFLDLTNLMNTGEISDRSYKLATYALTGFANFASVGIQIGGIGALCPERRADLARLGPLALFVGFFVTMLNAAIAGFLMPL